MRKKVTSYLLYPSLRLPAPFTASLVICRNLAGVASTILFLLFLIAVTAFLRRDTNQISIDYLQSLKRCPPPQITRTNISITPQGRCPATLTHRNPKTTAETSLSLDTSRQQDCQQIFQSKIVKLHKDSITAESCAVHPAVSRAPRHRLGFSFAGTLPDREISEPFQGAVLESGTFAGHTIRKQKLAQPFDTPTTWTYHTP